MSKSFEEELRDRIRLYEEHRQAGLYGEEKWMSLRCSLQSWICLFQSIRCFA